LQHIAPKYIYADASGKLGSCHCRSAFPPS
jgi:hypothetical protein